MSEKQDITGSLFEEQEEPVRESPYIEVSDDGLLAHLIIPDKPLVVDIEKLLSEKDINFGIDNELVTTINKSLYDGIRLERKHLIAKGKKPVFGQPGELILRTKKPEDIILSSDDLTKVDYKIYKRKLLALAEEEKPVAMIIDPTKGHDGMDVYGNPIKGADGEEVSIVMGANVYQSGKKLISKIDGLVEYKKSRDNTISFDISEVLLIKGDVDYTTGNVDFPGSVIVKGVIKAGFTVVAKNEVVADTIRGNVFTGGTVISKQGILGGVNKSEIKAGGSVYAKFVQGAHIVTEDSVVVKKSIIGSDIYAEGSVVLDGSPGSIIGGSIFAVNSIDAKIYGSESYVKTEVALYSTAKGVIELRKVVAKRFDISKNLLRIETYLGNNRDQLFNGISGDKTELINKLIHKRDALRKELLVKNAELKNIQAELTKPSENKIIVGKEIWPEVRVSISGKFILLKNERKKGYFFYDSLQGNIDFKG